jgi:uncharacterized membrane protein YecN with MAPEG domain
MPLVITPIHAGLFALFFVFLSLRVIRLRQAARIGLGDGGDRNWSAARACMPISPSTSP